MTTSPSSPEGPERICGGRGTKVIALIRGGLPGCRFKWTDHPPDDVGGNARIDPAEVSRGRISDGDRQQVVKGRTSDEGSDA